MSEWKKMDQCRLCPRGCGADRLHGQKGVCGAGGDLLAARAALHFWEEPCLSGKNGSGAVFFVGCALRCVYCQNYEISRAAYGKRITVSRLADIFLDLQDQGAHNVNLVTAGHFLPQAAQALEDAKNRGLVVPVVYNSSGYECAGALGMLDGLADIYLPDLKYLDSRLAAALSRAPDYPDAAKEALREMVRQQPACEFGPDGLMKRGVMVRHLVLPGHVREAKSVLRYLHETYGDQIWISILNQYTPTEAVKDDPLLGRTLTAREYGRAVDYALELGIRQAYIQEGAAARESFIPPFDGTGI